MVSRMLSLSILVIAQIFALTSAQNASSTATAGRTIQTYVINVGKADHKFSPDVTQAEIGDIIEFDFFPPNHSVVRAEYQYPCVPYELTGRGKVGFFSGFKPVDAILSNPPKWQVRINDTNPIFFYCSAIGSCINYGMVGVINPNASTSLETQRQMAKDSAYMLQPGQSFPAEGSTTDLPKTSASATSTPTTLSTSTTSAATSTTAAAISNSTVLTTGAIAGIAVGCAVVLALAAGLFYFFGRARTLKQEVNRVSSLPPHTPASMFQNHSLLGGGKGRSTKMTDSSSRHSGAMSPVQIPYDAWNQPRQEMAHGKAEYVVDVHENVYQRDPYANLNINRPQSDVNGGGSSNGGWGAQSASSGIPQRQPSVLLNPQGPMELHSPDPRRENF